MSLRLTPIHRVWRRLLHSAIVERTHGRLRDLHIEHEGDQVLLSGRCDSYHVFQLALSAADSVLNEWQAPVLSWAVRVKGRPLLLEQRAGNLTEEALSPPSPSKSVMSRRVAATANRTELALSPSPTHHDA
jgi:hypothetical protein